MNFLITSLPTAGKTMKNTNLTEISIEPLTYRQIMKYDSIKPNNDISKTIKDIDFLVKDIPHWQELSAYDLSSIIFTRKFLTATSDQEFVIEVDNQLYKLNTNEITFKDLNDEYLNMKKVTINNKEYSIHIPTIEEYYNVLKAFESKFQLEPWVTHYEIMILTSMGATPITILDYVYMFGNLIGDDIVTMEYLDKIINNVTNDITIKSEGGETVISVDKLITDLFRFVNINRKLDTSKINIE